MRLSLLTSKNLRHKIRYKLSVIARQKKRENFLKILPKNAVGAEIGVFKGEFTRYILEITKPKELHLIDLWWEIGEYFNWGGSAGNKSKISSREVYDMARKTVEETDSRKVSRFHVGDDLLYFSSFPDGYFDWVYLDSSHKYEHTKKELELLRHKIKSGGLIAGHDWYKAPAHVHHGVYKAVNEFCERYHWRVLELDHFSQWCIEQDHGRE